MWKKASGTTKKLACVLLVCHSLVHVISLCSLIGFQTLVVPRPWVWGFVPMQRGTYWLQRMITALLIPTKHLQLCVCVCVCVCVVGGGYMWYSFREKMQKMDIIYEHYNPNLGVKCIYIVLQHNTKLQFLACDKWHDLPFEANPLIHWVCAQLGKVEIFYAQIDSTSVTTAPEADTQLYSTGFVGLRYWWRCCMSAGRGTRDQLNTDIPRRLGG